MYGRDEERVNARGVRYDDKLSDRKKYNIVFKKMIESIVYQ